jgi:UDP:flavonoid glycosyltransferase YjiC (YdhE family)
MARRILFIAEGVTMTHFTRPAALAESLDCEDYELHFWTPRRYHRLLRQRFARLGDLRTIDPNQFLASLSSGDQLYTEKVLSDYVRDDLEIIDEVQPDLIIGDFRLSLNISAPLRQIPYASIFNAHWSPYRHQPAIVPELPLTRWIPPRLLSPLFAALRPSIYAAHARPVNAVRRSFGLPPISDDLRYVYTSGDLVLYPDVPEFVPLHGAPAHHQFVGPCCWSPAVARPAWWKTVMNSSRPKIFVSLGSSGPLKALPAVLHAASQLPVDVILSTSGRAQFAGSKVYSAELLPYEETARNCDLVVSHGGTGGLYPALSAGTPLLAIPSNIDNHLSAAILADHGAGLSVRVESASTKNLLRAMKMLLSDPHFKSRALDCAANFRRHETSTAFPKLISEWFAKREALRHCMPRVLCEPQALSAVTQ